MIVLNWKVLVKKAYWSFCSYLINESVLQFYVNCESKACVHSKDIYACDKYINSTRKHMKKIMLCPIDAIVNSNIKHHIG